MASCVREGNKAVSKMVFRASGKLSREARYRLSGFSIVYDEGDVHLIWNMFTSQLLLLTSGEREALTAVQDSPVSFSYLEQHGLVELAERRFLVTEDCNEEEEYLQILEVMRMMRKPPDGLNNYVIFPTTGCNARCPYCFESDFVPATMTEETVLATVDYIERTMSKKKPIDIRWFGGEPLVAASRIDLFCTEFERRGIEFTSNIVTNASLLTPELVDKAHDLWHLCAAQVSLDGCRADFELRKRFLTPLSHNYDTVIRNIHLLADKGVKVILRCNYDEGNLEGLPEFVDDLGREFGGMKNVRMYFALLFDERMLPTAPELIRAVRDVEDQAVRYGIFGERTFYTRTVRPRACMADEPDRTQAIDPMGQLQNCEHLNDCRIFGTVWDGITNQELYDTFSSPYEVDEPCHGCTFLPLCSPGVKKICSNSDSLYCREMCMAQMENIMHREAVKIVAKRAEAL